MAFLTLYMHIRSSASIGISLQKKINIFKLLIIKLISMFDICISIYIIIVIIITTTTIIIIIIIIITMKSEK